MALRSVVLRALLVALVIAGGAAAPLRAAPTASLAPGRELVVATKEAPPFAMKQRDGTWRGISIDLWKRIAGRLGLRYRFAEVPTVQALVDGTASGSFDAAIAALTVTAAREERVDFTQPFFSTGLGVAVPVEESAWRAIVHAFLSFGFLQAVAVLLGIAFGVGLLIWLLERRKTEYFGGGARGLGSGVWWSAIAMTQAGAGQNAPATLPGRVVAAGWMIASIIAIAVFTAGVTSSLTKRELQGSVHSLNDLRSVRVGAVAGSATVDFLDRQQVALKAFGSPEEGLKALAAGRIDAFVYDKPILTWIVLQQFSSTARVLDISFDPQAYAIALPKGSALRSALDLAVLEEVESDWWDQTMFQYFGAARPR
ncbi:MAG TPA: transporter substrate-binding domain-containing protein [Hyphomicrobiales bacterium]|nr:transporter substrate-binding domain-containing protein [Hyphomicrobiales bacterium]